MKAVPHQQVPPTYKSPTLLNTAPLVPLSAVHPCAAAPQTSELSRQSCMRTTSMGSRLTEPLMASCMGPPFPASFPPAPRRALAPSVRTAMISSAVSSTPTTAPTATTTTPSAPLCWRSPSVPSTCHGSFNNCFIHLYIFIHELRRLLLLSWSLTRRTNWMKYVPTHQSLSSGILITVIWAARWELMNSTWRALLPRGALLSIFAMAQ